MTSILLLLNTASGSYTDASATTLTDAFTTAGLPAPAIHRFPDVPLPDIHRLKADGYDTLAVYTGDGTINSVAAQLAGWDGTILPLPGGTQNLFSKKLHGDRDVTAIVADFAAGRGARVYPPVVVGQAMTALVTLIAGPTTAWAEVREQVRQGDIGAVAEALPTAVSQTLSGDGVSIDGQDKSYQAITLSPSDAGIIAQGVLTDGPARLLRQGAAWLGGDFRNGPHDALGTFQHLRIVGNGPIGLLVDGEQCEAQDYADFHLGKAKVAMWSTAATPPAA